MKQTCKYHPAEQANWFCSHDGILFCDDCVAIEESGDRARCFLCNKPVSAVGRRIAQDPFWRILSHFVEYPFAREPMLLALVACLPLGLLPPDLVGFGIAAGLGVLLGGMGAAMAEQTINGQMRPPGIRAVLTADPWPAGVQQWLLFALACIGTGYAYVYLGMIMGSLVALAVWLVLPAFLLELHIGGSLLNVLFQPQRPFGHMFTVGVDYFIAWGVLFGLFTAGAILASILHDLLPHLVGWPLAGMVAAWMYFMTMHLVGYLACQHREALGYLTVATELTERRRRNRRPEDDRRMRVLLQEGRFDKVVSLYKLRLEKRKQDLGLTEQYERILQALGRDEERLELADDYLGLLLKDDQPYRVLELLKRYRETDPAFKPGTAQLTWDVAQLLAENGQQKLAVNLLQDLHKRAPTWPQLPAAYLFIARLLKNEFNLPGKAEQYIRFVETRFREPKNQDLARACREELGLARA
jgi:tetratricopeptide (TPR) repeat protein